MDDVEQIEEQYDHEYVPQVQDTHKPQVGQEFDSIEEVHSFYNRYAKDAGFSIRTNSSRRNKETMEILRKEFVCSKEGNVRDGEKEKSRRRGITREGCKAKLAVVMTQSKSYTVSVFVEAHNHPLTTPRRVHLLRSHRHVSEAKKCLSQQFSAANIPAHQRLSVFELQAGGLENVGCTQRDLYNYERDLRNEMKGQDVEMLYEYFQSKRNKNNEFYFHIELDSENRLTHCFWADSNSRAAYAYFGDVIVFDTTYNTNRYGMIFAPIVGVNNHFQTTIFASAFLCDETTDSFIWLFEQFKNCMYGSHPKMIITDQDPAMTRAISHSFPHTLHRYCIWHIVNKFSERLNAVVYKDCFNDFQSCIWGSETCEEFDNKWMEVVEKNDLGDNSWLQLIFGLREKWVPAFVNHVFSAGMTSSQRAEGCHAFFKQYVSKRNSLMDFVLRFNRAVARQRHEELKADHTDLHESPILKLPLEMEKQMASIYTRTMFYKFQDQLWNCLLYVVDFVRDDLNERVFKVENRSGCGRTRVIVYEKNSDFVSCSCKKFESEGLPCRHLLAYLMSTKENYLPANYILTRWTKEAKSRAALDDERVQLINDGCDNSLMFRRTQLHQLASEVIDKVVSNEDACSLFTMSLENVLESTQTMFTGSSSGHASERRCSRKASNEISFNEPLQVRAKGCGKRMKGGKEKNTVRARHCHGCGKVGHNKRSCPQLNKRNISAANEANLEGLSEDDTNNEEEELNS